MKRNQNFENLVGSYLFPEVVARKNVFLHENPSVNLISLGVGDTTQPISKHIVKALINASTGLGTPEKYVGYGPEQGHDALRKKIACKVYNSKFSADEVFISDGANGDLNRLQLLFGGNVSIAVQDPSYPVYLEGSVIQGVKNIVKMACLPQNDFFPDLNSVKATDLIYFCSPNNPTGAVATKKQLQELIKFAKKNRSIIIFDAAYAAYIKDDSLPKSIYEIEGAEEVAIEVGSFSKSAGFTGVRLGWTVIPKELKYCCQSSVLTDWNRLVTTVFNGASNISQAGGLAALDDEGLHEISELTDFYMENAQLIKNALESKGYVVYGGVNAPYLWVDFKAEKSWDIFQHFLEKKHLVTIPGSGFGAAGEGFIRLTAFGDRDKILQAIERI